MSPERKQHSKELQGNNEACQRSAPVKMYGNRMVTVIILFNISYLDRFVCLATASMTGRKKGQRSTAHGSITYTSTVTGLVTW